MASAALCGLTVSLSMTSKDAGIGGELETTRISDRSVQIDVLQLAKGRTRLTGETLLDDGLRATQPAKPAHAVSRTPPSRSRTAPRQDPRSSGCGIAGLPATR